MNLAFMLNRGTRVFISKPLEEVDLLIEFAKENQVDLIAESLIEFECLMVLPSKAYQVVFFGSKRAVDCYLNHNSIPFGVKVACVGESTKNYLEGKGFAVGFIPSTNSPNEGAKEFQNWLGDRKVLFPLSNRSLKTFSKNIPEEQKEELIVYNTVFLIKSIEICDYYAFSSPSNFEAFVQSNTIPKEAKLIAWGESTAKEIRKAGFDVSVLEEPSVNGLITFLEK